MTVLPYVSAALVLIPGLVVGLKFAILLLFAIFVVAVRIIHEKAGVEVTGMPQKQKRPGDDRRARSQSIPRTTTLFRHFQAAGRGAIG